MYGALGTSEEEGQERNMAGHANTGDQEAFDQAFQAAMGNQEEEIDLYALLGVERACDDKELGRAYKKKALRMHPDKGGDPEKFKQMKWAYDVLKDPSKRRVYDSYGVAGVRMMEGKVDPGTAMQAFMNASPGARSEILGYVTAAFLVGFVLPSVLFCVRWDGLVSWHWAAALAPILVFLGCSLLGVCGGIISADPFTVEMPEEMAAQPSEQEKKEFAAGKQAFLHMLTVQLLILALRLTGIIMLCVRMTLGPDASAAPFTYLGAISPLMASAVFETGQEVMTLVAFNEPTPHLFAEYGNTDHLLTGVQSTLSGILYVCSLCLVGLSADGVFLPSLGAARWFISVSPYMLNSVLDIVVSALRENGIVDSKAPASAGGSFCFAAFKAIVIYLGAWKLSDSSALSAFEVLLPFFIVLGCGWCCIACVICAGPDIMQEEAANQFPQRDVGNGRYQEAGVDSGSVADGPQAGAVESAAAEASHSAVNNSADASDVVVQVSSAAGEDIEGID